MSRALRHLPLPGSRVLVPRGGDWGSRATASITARGGVAEVCPLISITQPRDTAQLAAAVTEWNSGAYDWLAVTSANAVEAITAAGAAAYPGCRTAALGPATAAALQRFGFPLSVLPAVRFTGAGLAESLRAALRDGPQRILFPASEIAGSDFEDSVRDAGHTVDRVTAYRTEPVPPDAKLAARVARGEFDAILVTSGSVARSLSELARVNGIPDDTIIAALGAPTASALNEAGITADVISAVHTIDGLLDAVSRAITPPKGPRS